MRPITVTVGNLVTAASATAIRTSSSAIPGDLVLNGAQVVNGIGVLEADRNLLFTVTIAAEVSRLAVEGINTAGLPMSETIFVPAGFTGTILSVNQYRKVTRVNASGIITFLTIGTSATGTSPWVSFDGWSNGDIAIQANVTGTANYTVQSTLDNPNDVTSPYYNNPNGVVWVNTSDTVAVGASTGIQSNFLFAPQFARILLNSGTGLVTATFAQSGAS